MRSVRIVVRQVTGSMPALVAASVLGSISCGDAATTPHGSGGSVGVSSAGASFGGTSSSGATSVVIVDPSAGASFESGGGTTGLPNDCQSYEVALPDPGTPAEPGTICAITVEPVMSSAAARVSFVTVDEGDSRRPTRGMLTLDPALRGAVIGTPALVVTAATEKSLLRIGISALEPTSDGYTFELTWPVDAIFRANDMTRVSFRAELELSCETGSRLVHTLSELHLCGDEGLTQEQWVGAGEECVQCRIIAELVASPIIPQEAHGTLPLGRALRARIVELSRVGDSVLLLAENDGGTATEYDWRVTGGSVERLAPDVVIVRKQFATSTPHVQVAISSDDGVAVVSYAYPGAGP